MDSRDATFLRGWSIFCIALFVATWKLWFPGFTDFPRVPVWLDPNLPVLIPLHFLASATVVAGLLWILATGVRYFSRTKFGSVAIGLAVTFLCNQHCLQPWAWQTFILAVLLFCFRDSENFRRWAGRLLISIYLFSAVGKFDYQFVHTLGDSFLSTILDWANAEDAIADEVRPWAVGLFPAGELAIAVGLMFEKTRRVAAVAAIGLHLVLFAILSPIGLNHRPAVLIWNAMSILLVSWLFLSPSRRGDSDAGSNSQSRGTAGWSQVAGIIFAIVVLTGPLLRPMQLWDHWLAWGLYSPSNSRVELLVSERAKSVLPPAISKHLQPTATGGMLKMKLDLWSLEAVNAPIYPQARFQKSVAEQLLQREQLQQQTRLRMLGPAHPWTGRRATFVVAPSEEN